MQNEPLLLRAFSCACGEGNFPPAPRQHHIGKCRFIVSPPCHFLDIDTGGSIDCSLNRED
jgi:hypothetical protein